MTDAQKRLDAIFNEQVKLIANSLDRASTAFITVGVLGPIIGYFYGLGGASAVPQLYIICGTAFSLVMAAVLHWLARRTLGSMR